MRVARVGGGVFEGFPDVGVGFGQGFWPGWGRGQGPSAEIFSGASRRERCLRCLKGFGAWAEGVSTRVWDEFYGSS